MTATMTLSAAILRRRYARGVPRAQHTEFPIDAAIEKKTDFVGDDYILALQTENPQGFGTTIPDAQASAAQGVYKKFALSKLELFGVCRIKGQVLRAAVTRGDGALVDLWQRELDGTEKTFLKQLEIYHMGTGNGVLGTISTGVTGTEVTLTVVEDINNFDVGMKVKLVSDTTLSPTVRSGDATITAINRSAGKLTIGSNWNSAITGATNGDSIVRAGTQAASAANAVPAGWRKWLEGGSTPGTWKGLDRNEDPVRLASQSLDMTGLPMAEAIIDLESLISNQGHNEKLKLVGHPRDFRQVKKTAFGKATFSGGGGTPTLFFNGAKWASDRGGEIDTILSPFCPRNNVFLKDMSSYALYSLGAAPMPLDFDKQDMLRLATDDAYEARIGMYGESGEHSPVTSARGTGWGS